MTFLLRDRVFNIMKAITQSFLSPRILFSPCRRSNVSSRKVLEAENMRPPTSHNVRRLGEHRSRNWSTHAQDLRLEVPFLQRRALQMTEQKPTVNNLPPCLHSHCPIAVVVVVVARPW